MLPASVVCSRHRQDLPLALARITSSRMTSASTMAALKLFIFLFFYLLFNILKTPHRILSMHEDERSARLKNRFSNSACRPSLTFTKHLIEDFIGTAHLLILWLEIFGKINKNFEQKKNFFSVFFSFILSLHNKLMFSRFCPLI